MYMVSDMLLFKYLLAYILQRQDLKTYLSVMLTRPQPPRPRPQPKAKATYLKAKNTTMHVFTAFIPDN